MADKHIQQRYCTKIATYGALGVALAGSAVSGSAAGTISTAEEVLSWERCVAEARDNNLQLKVAGLEIERSGHLVRAVKGGSLPQVTASADAGRSYTQSPNDQDTGWNQTNQYSYGITAKQSLFSGFKDEAALEGKQVGLEVSKAALDKSRSQVGYDLRVAFINLLYTQELLSLQAIVADRQKENVRLVNLRFQGGRENRGSVLKGQAALRQATADIAAATDAVRSNQTQLAKYLGRKSWSPLRASGRLALPTATEPTDWTALALQTPGRREADANIKASEASLRAVKGKHYPDLSAFASATRSGEWPPNSNKLSVGLSLSIPLYTGGTTTEEVNSAAVDVAKAQAQRQSQDMETLAALQVAFVDLQNAIRRVGVAEDTLSATQLQSEIAKNQYSLGLISFQDWDLIEGNLASAERSLLSSRRDAELADANWKKAQGLTPFSVERAQ